MPIEGNLTEMSLVEIVQFNCQNRSTAKVTVRNDAATGTIYFNQGQVIHAVYDTDTGEEAFYQLIGWPEGSFVIEKDVNSPEKSIVIPWNALLLQGMQYLDEQRARKQEKLDEEVNQEAAITQDALQTLANNLNGFVAAHLVHINGDIVATLVTETRLDEATVTDVLFQLIEQASELMTVVDAGAFKESITMAGRFRFIIRPVGHSDYYIQIILTRDGSIGAARMYLEEGEENLLRNLNVSAREG